MNNKSFSLLLIAIGLAGCQSTSSTPKSVGNKLDNGVVDCGYNNIDSAEYIKAPDYKMRYITNIFSSDPTAQYEKQFNNPSYFAPLATEKFKITSTEIKNKYYYNNATGKPNSRLKTDNVLIDGNRYEYQNASDVKVITESCKVYWLKRIQYIEQTVSNVSLSDGSDFVVKNYEEILGANNFRKFNPPEAKVTYDKFTKISKIESTFDNSLMLRTWVKNNVKDKPKKIQIYADVHFLDKWGHLSKAFTETGLVTEITKIDTDIDCSNSKLLGGCSLTETIGISLPYSFYESHKQGFEVKVQGTRSKVIKVKDYQVQQILDAVASFEK
ncbi:hypothetical protein [Pseudoalteromonas sp. BSi20495]|uniref:hypothetical protein n=1 Tax=Pseudoalteromonas sp. BSi20495 TaxID=386429 RepID=UPI00023159BC|nr:hypothetical protein [Pseudoalteromonas sp. BSi20495]GAA78187.1 hypothetical protein P20495_0678 [Pseudoalteromonas sp. BSi20495]